MTPEFNRAYRLGWNAFVGGRQRKANPYSQLRRTEYLAWRQGWDEAEMQQEDAQAAADQSDG